MSAQGLRQKTVSGVFWHFLEVSANQGINLLVTFILAYFLVPDDFGLIAMLSVFFELANALMEAGFRQALIRKKEATPLDYSTMFITNLVFGCIAYVLLVLLSPWIADFFKEPRLIFLIRIVGVVIIINAFQFIHLVDLSRRLDFRTQFKAMLPANILSGIFAVIMAVSGMGVWSLVARMIFMPVCKTAALWKLNPVRPALAFSKKTFFELWGFGSKLVISRFLNVFFDNIYVMVIGKFFSTTALGGVYFAQRIQSTLLNQLTVSIQGATFPALANIQDEEQRLKSAYRKIMKVTAYIIFPAMSMLAVLSVPLFSSFLNENWSISAVYLQILCFAGFMYPMHAINQNLLQVKGRSDLFLYLESVKKIVVVAVLFITVPFGIIAMLWGRVATSLLNYLPTIYFTNRILDYSAGEQFKDLLPTFVCSLFSALSVLCLDLFFALPEKSLFWLFVRSLTGIAAYLVFSLIARLESQEIVWQIIIQRLHFKKLPVKEN